MKQFHSIVEGTWIESVLVELTEQQKTLSMSKEESDKDAKLELREWIKSQKERQVNKTTSSKLTTLYNSKKPELKETDVYELISADINEDLNGIINCRVNGEHNQIRF